MEYFEKLGSEAAKRWKKLNYDERRFHEVATDVLTQMPPSSHTSFDEVVKYALMSEALPNQADPGASFGQPPLTVFDSRDFRIEVLFWTGVTPSIHQHAFSGAFHVLHGSSIHISWDFDFQERVSSHFHYGHVQMKKAELLKVGDIRPIIAGPGFIHTTFHLDLPTVSVVVRTTNEQDNLPQYSFYPPNIAYNTRDNETYIRRKLQVLAMLISSGRAGEHDRLLKEMLVDVDTYAAFNYLYQAHSLRDKAGIEDILATANLHHPRLVKNLVPALAHVRRQGEITHIRKRVSSDEELRFFLALLINITHLETMLALLQQRYAGADPVAKFIAAIQRLSEAGLLGEKLSEPWIYMLECLLRGQTAQAQILKAFGEKYGQELIEKHQGNVNNIFTSVSGFWLFRPLFAHLRQSEQIAQRAS